MKEHMGSIRYFLGRSEESNEETSQNRMFWPRIELVHPNKNESVVA
jgi:hypothetical protein